MDTTDRVVIVATGFGVWQNGRHLASARWTDIVQVRALTLGPRPTDLPGVAVGLRDGTEIVIHEALPGFRPFLAAAEQALPGMRRWPTSSDAQGRLDVGAEPAVLFDRARRGP